jgi:hypothetical protein
MTGDWHHRSRCTRTAALARDMYARYAYCEAHTAKPGHPAFLVGAHARVKRTGI